MGLKPPAPLRLVAWFFILQGLSSGLGTLASLAQQRPSVDVTLGSLLLGFGLLKVNRWIRWASILSILVQLVMAGMVLHAAVRGGEIVGEGRIFSFVVMDLPPAGVTTLMIGLSLILVASLVYLLLPDTRSLFTGKSQARPSA